MNSTPVEAPLPAVQPPLGDGIPEKPAVNGELETQQREQSLPASYVPSNPSAFTDNASLPAIATVPAPLKPQIANILSEPSPAQTSPSDDASSDPQHALAPLSAEQPQHSHPTPPPEESYPVVAPVQDAVAETPASTQVPAQPEQSSEPAPVVEPVSTSADNLVEMPVVQDVLAQPTIDPVISQPTMSSSEPQPILSLVRPREEDLEEDEPSAKRNKVEDEAASTEAHIKAEATQPPSVNTDVTMTDAPTGSIEPTTPVTAPTASSTVQYYSAPMTDLQKAFLIDKTKNLKKTKHALPFMMPVDIVKLNIPNYPNVVKNPMDLGTLENKLKNDQYGSPQEYADDFNLIVSNTRLFNGDVHAVTISAFNMEAYFKKYMGTLPGPQDTAQPKAIKRASPAAPRPQPRREARQPPPAPVSPAQATQTFALQADGTPQIRRDSTNTKRPHRTIKPPQNRELSYAKPKRKEHQMELKFCEHVLDEIRGPKHAHQNHIFQTPVDPVALNIPQYRQIIKTPMDLATMGQKLKTGQYATAQEFRGDFELMINNCLLFNPPGNPVRDIGVELRRAFNALWEDKQKWERANKKNAQADSDSEESEEESEEDEEDPAQAAAQATIAALTKQLAELQKTVATQWGDGKKKKTKEAKKKEKKSSLGGASKSKPAPKAKAQKKTKPLSYEDKNEISSAVGNMNEAQVGRLTQIITDNCEKYRNMGDDMELEIDDLPNDVQHLLLKHVRSIFGNPNRQRADSPDDLAAEDDDDYKLPARDRAAAGGKRKKHKPMGKREQQENIAELRKSLAAFNNPTSESGSPTSASYQTQGMPADDTSGDEESEESEEE